MEVIGRTLRFTLGLALGIGIGAAAALLLTPQSGKPYRDQIQQRFNGMLSAAKEAKQEREKELQEYWEQEIDNRNSDEGAKKS